MGCRGVSSADERGLHKHEGLVSKKKEWKHERNVWEYSLSEHRCRRAMQVVVQ